MFGPWFNLAFAPFVVAQRLPLLWLEAATESAPGRLESERMVTEKAIAMQLGLMGAQTQMMKTGFAISTAMMTDRPLKGVAAATDGARRIAEAAVIPAGKRVRANARRLSRQ